MEAVNDRQKRGKRKEEKRQIEDGDGDLEIDFKEEFGPFRQIRERDGAKVQTISSKIVCGSKSLA